MDSSTKRLILIVIAIIAVASFFTDGFKNRLGIDKNSEDSITQTENMGATASSAPSVITIKPLVNSLEMPEIRQLVQTLKPDARKELLSDSNKFQIFIQQQLAQKSMLNLLINDGVSNKEPVQFLMQKSAEKALLEWYLNQLILKNLATDFPNEQQIKEFYEANQETFVIGERVHLWQILLPIQANATKEQLSEYDSTAKKIREDIVKGRITFADAALQYSKNSPSRENGGYVGLVKLDELAENVKQEVLALKQDELSQPIQTDNAFHIVKHGIIVAEQAVELQQISGRIREVLRKQEVDNIRKALIDEAQKKYPANVEANQIEEWRLKLRSGL